MLLIAEVTAGVDRLADLSVGLGLGSGHVQPVHLVESMRQQWPHCVQLYQLEVVELGLQPVLRHEHVHRRAELGLPDVPDILEQSERSPCSPLCLPSTCSWWLTWCWTAPHQT